MPISERPASVGDGAIEAALKTVPLFSDLTPDLLQVVRAEVQTRVVLAGTTIFRLGEAGSELFIVRDGCVQIYLPSGAGDDVVAELTAGQWFGEMALITGEPRSASARATTATTLLAMSRDSFQMLLTRVPALALTLSQELSRRLRSHLLRRPSRPAPNLIVLEDHEPTPASAGAAVRVAEMIAAELDQTVGLLDLVPASAAVDAARGSEAVVRLSSPATMEGIEEVVQTYATVVVRLWPGHPLGERIRTVAGVHSAPDLLRDALTLDGEPTLTGVLAGPLQQRVRRVLNRRVGLVFGAGGAKGLTHIGALRCFENAGLRFDMLAGTSIGACVAALAALGWESARILEFAQDLRRHFRKLLLDFGVPSGSLLRGRKKTALLKRLTAGRTFADLTVPLWTVAADLVTGRESVFSSGELWEALDATTAIPTMFPAVTLGQRVLVDGWVVNPFPTDVLRREGADVVVGIDPNVADEPAARRASRPPRRGRWRRFLDLRRLIDPAGIVRVAMRSIDVGARERVLTNLALADVCVQPLLGAYSITDIQKLDAIVAAGEAAAEHALPAILRTMRHAGHATAQGA